MQVISENQLQAGLSSRLWICSHGGVSSEALTAALGVRYPKTRSSTSNRPFIGCAAHFPFPPKTGPSACIYIYGDVIKSILSQIRRGHYDNPIKLKNDERYPKINTLKDLLEIKSPDPFGIKNQINAFHTNQTDYPIILLKYPFNSSSLTQLEEALGICLHPAFQVKERSTSFKDFDQDEIDKLIAIYNPLQRKIDALPNIAFRLPISQASGNNKFFEQFCTRRTIPKPQTKNLIGKRIKHVIHINANLSIYNERGVNGGYLTEDIFWNGGSGRIRAKHIRNIRSKQLTYDSQLKVHDSIKLDGDFSGIEDPRIIPHQKHDFIIFNALKNNGKRSIFIQHVHTEYCVELKIEGFSDSSKKEEKNWTPFQVGAEVFFLYSLQPLCILRLKNFQSGECVVIHGDPKAYSDDATIFGSTPLVPYTSEWYVGFAHTRNPYRAIPYAYNHKKRIINVADKTVTFPTPKKAISTRGRSVQFPYDLVLSDASAKIFIEFEDMCPSLVEISLTHFAYLFSGLIEEKCKSLKTIVAEDGDQLSPTSFPLEIASQGDKLVTDEIHPICFNSFCEALDASARERFNNPEFLVGDFPRLWQLMKKINLLARPEAKILDLGGEGGTLRHLINSQKCLRNKHLYVENSIGDLRYPLNNPSNYYDIVICTEVIENLKDRPEFCWPYNATFTGTGIMNLLCEANRVLKHNCHIIITTPNAGSANAIARANQGLHPFNFEPHPRELSIKNLTQYLRSCGFNETNIFRDEFDAPSDHSDSSSMNFQVAGRRLIATAAKKAMPNEVLLNFGGRLSFETTCINGVVSTRRT